jgi:aminoglycoside phosphotransferase (APT) family kinase protein
VLVPQRYSERLGLIEPDQLREAAARFDLGDVREAYPAAGGLFGQNVVLSTASGRYVLRGNPHGHAQLTKERRVARFLDERSSLPAPWPYRVCDDASIFGWTFAIMPMLAGEPGHDLAAVADDDARVALAEATGEALARMHEATSEFFGPYDAQFDDFIEMDDFGDWFGYRLEHWRDACRSVGALPTEAELWIDDLLDECADALDEPFTPVLVHHDFKIENLSFVRRDAGFEATGVFDLGEAYLGDPEEDLVRSVRHARTDDEAEAFVDAYVAVHPLRPDAPDRLALYALCDFLVVWEYARRMGTSGFDEDASFVATVRPVVERARSIAKR